MEETKRRRFIIRAVLEGEVDVQDAPVSDWILVGTYPSTDFRNASLSNNYNNSAHPYTTTTAASPRVSKEHFIPLAEYAGYLCKLEYEATASDEVYYGINTYNNKAMTSVSNNSNISSSNTKPHGWFASGDEFTLETSFNSSPLASVRLNFSCGSEHNVEFTPDQISNIRLYVKEQ